MEKLLQKDDALPSLPEIFFKVSNQLDDVDISAQEIGKTIANDPAISYKVLTMVNSAYFGFKALAGQSLGKLDQFFTTLTY